MVHRSLYKERYNAIVARIKKTARNSFTIVGKDRVAGTENLRPDLVIQDNNGIILFDVIVPFEIGPEAFETVKKNKFDK